MTIDNDPLESFNEHYRSGNTPWDSGISPPELLEAVTGPTALAPGRMLDIGCGTGTNSLTLARLGWQTVGVDFVSLAIERANQKAKAVVDEIARAGGSVCFIQADVIRLAAPAPDERFSLLLDLSCAPGTRRWSCSRPCRERCFSSTPTFPTPIAIVPLAVRLKKSIASSRRDFA